MSRRFTRLSLLSVLLLSSEVWAIGLGDIQLDSALNEPLRAEIQLLSATPDEIIDLKVELASADTFARYGIDRPFFLQNMEFNIVNGGVAGSVVQIRSRAPITEPFLTFLVEATWASGRLLREYTVLLDPPTYAPPSAQQAPAVTAPSRSTQTDSGRIERQPAPQQPAATTQPRSAPQPASPPQTSQPTPQPAADDVPYDTASGGDLVVRRGDTLWGIASRLRPDSRLTMNQTMLAIYEANRGAFGGNINMLREGASLRIPSADEVFQISRGAALSEVQRQNNAWSGDAGYTAPADTSSTPSLTLVPPDEEPAGTSFDDDATTFEPLSREDEISNRIAELEAADVPNQPSLIQIRDNELAALRQELANIRGEVYEPPVDDTVVDDTTVDDTVVDDAADDIFVDDADDTAIDDVMADDTDDAMVDDTAADDAVDDAATPTNVISSAPADDESIVDKVVGFLTDGIWGIIIGALVLVAGALIWFMKRGDDDDAGPWETLDTDEVPSSNLTGTMTATMHAPTGEEAIVVVEQDSGVHPVIDETVETPAGTLAHQDGSESFGSLEDTFSSETAVNLDQTDPVAEADFHMAYGLYDQAADLINGALESDPGDTGLLSKLCEIYFVWGNRDSFVDAASRLKSVVGGGASAEWDKIVIMGQQIAADDAMFAGAEVAGATKAVDLSFDEGGEDAGALDMDFGAEDTGDTGIIDMGAPGSETNEAVDFLFDEADAGQSVDMNLETTAENPTVELEPAEPTVEMPSTPDDSPTAESPTIEEQFEGFDGGTSELPSLDLDDTMERTVAGAGTETGSTAEINLDELDLNIDGLGESDFGALDDLDATGQMEALADTGINEALDDAADATGKNPEIDPDSTGVRERLEMETFEDLNETAEMRLATDETGRSPLIDAENEQEPTDVSIDESLLEATGRTQILSEDMAVDTAADLAGGLADDDATMLAPGLGDDDSIESLSSDAETLLASLDDNDDDFDFAKTEALPPEAFTGDATMDETAGVRAVAETNVDLDLDDLTAALQVSDIGDTVEQPRDDATVEQPRPSMSDATSEIPTMALAPEEMSDDLYEARTMTEVGTKLDLARAYVDMGDPAGARSILEEVLDEGDNAQKQQAQQLLDSLPS